MSLNTQTKNELIFAHEEARHIAADIADLDRAFAQSQELAETRFRTIEEQRLALQRWQSGDHGLSELVACLEKAVRCLRLNATGLWEEIYPPDMIAEAEQVLVSYRKEEA